MDDTLVRLWNDMIGRLTGPLTFRLILQPTMATIFAVRDGLKDARKGRPPYFWSIFTHPETAAELLSEGAKAVGRIIYLGIAMDLAYQLLVFRWVYPFELVFVVMLLAFVPYLLMRGPVNRIARLWIPSKNVPTP
jgi:hypothetical protein